MTVAKVNYPNSVHMYVNTNIPILPVVFNRVTFEFIGLAGLQRFQGCPLLLLPHSIPARCNILRA